jgi:hypothetical protein
VPLDRRYPPSVERSALRADFPDCWALYRVDLSPDNPSGWIPVEHPFCSDCVTRRAAGAAYGNRYDTIPETAYRPIVLELHARAERCAGCKSELIPEPSALARYFANRTAGARAAHFNGNRWVRGETLTDNETRSAAVEVARRTVRNAAD